MVKKGRREAEKKKSPRKFFLNLSKLFVVRGSFFEKVMRRSSERSCEGEQCACEARKSCEAVFERAGWGRVSEFVSACQKKSITHSKERET